MAAATQSIQRSHKGGRETHTAVGVKAGAVIFAGIIVARAAAEDVAQPASDTADLVCLGMSVDELDNTAGADGVVDPVRPERTVKTTDGEYAFPIAGVAVPAKDAPAYVVDDSTVTAETGVGLASVEGIKCGTFTRPGPFAGWWFVRLDRAWA
jgi:hypothetical protein